MISVSSTRPVNANRNVLDMVGLSTDVLPTDGSVDGWNLTNGSTILLMDTGTVKIYSEEDATWYEL